MFSFICFAGGYPGTINSDTAGIFHEARGLNVSDCHGLTAAHYLLKHAVADGTPIPPDSLQLKTRKAMFATLAIASIACVLTVPFVVVINRAIFGAVSSRPESSVELFDLAGISAMRGVDQFAAEGLIPAGTQNPSVVSCYEPSSGNNYIWGDCKWVSVALVERGLATSPDMFRAWLHAIVTHPKAYALHRIGYMKLLLERKSAADFFDYVGATNTPQGVTSLPADWRDESDFWTPRLPIVTTVRVLEPFLSIGFGFPVVWILADIICIGIIVTLRIRNRGDPATAIDDVIVASAASSLLSLVTFAFLAPSYTARYLFWTYISTLIAILLFVARSRSLAWPSFIKHRAA